MTKRKTRQLIRRAGGINAIAEHFGISVQAVYQWERIPPERVLAIEALSKGKILRHLMRPDIYPVPELQAAG